MSNGFVYVASKHEEFINAARFSANSLKDFWPESNITLFTHEEWVKEDDNLIFNNIVTEDVPYHKRAKLWALDKTPYDLTCYIDSDTYIVNSEIKKIFKQHDIDSDISLTRARRYAAAIKCKFKGGELTDHCGLFIYNNKPHTMNFMKQWWLLYCEQDEKKWIWNTDLYPEYLRPWDMWTYWWLQNMTEHKIKRSYFSHPDAKWNFVYIYKEKELDGHEPIIIHQPVPRKK